MEDKFKFTVRFPRFCRALAMNAIQENGRWYWNQRDPINRPVAFVNNDICVELRRMHLLTSIEWSDLPPALQTQWRKFMPFPGSRNELLIVESPDQLLAWSKNPPFSSLKKLNKYAIAAARTKNKSA